MARNVLRRDRQAPEEEWEAYACRIAFVWLGTVRRRKGGREDAGVAGRRANSA